MNFKAEEYTILFSEMKKESFLHIKFMNLSKMAIFFTIQPKVTPKLDSLDNFCGRFRF